MAKDGPGGERTEKPTPQRLKKARREGQIPRTPELGIWLGMAAASMLLPTVVGNAFTRVSELCVQIGVVIDHPEVAQVSRLFGQALSAFLSVILPLLLGVMAVGVLASAGQGGVTFATKALKPSLKKFNPFTGLKRMFGVRSLWETTKALLKIAALAGALFATSGQIQQLVATSGALPLSAIISTSTGAALSLFRVAAVTGLALAIADYVVARRQTMNRLKMSRYEITQEMKQQEGDPHVKSHRRSAALAMARNRMLSDVANADVMLINPTHVAVALKYDSSRGAPRVVAKGAGAVAAKLREKAAEHRVPMVQDIPLARALHASCDLGQEVPPQLFTAVARVLAFVMQLKARGVAAGVHRPGFPAPATANLPKAGRRR